MISVKDFTLKYFDIRLTEAQKEILNRFNTMSPNENNVRIHSGRFGNNKFTAAMVDELKSYGWHVVTVNENEESK